MPHIGGISAGISAGFAIIPPMLFSPTWNSV